MSHDPRIRFFDDHAAKWDSYGPPIEQVLARLEALRPLLGVVPGTDVLEIGCGTGRVTAWLAEAVAPGRVSAIDFSPAMLELARERDIDAEFRLADACADELGQAAFDLVFCMHVFPHFRDPAGALRRIASALRPGGRLLVLHLIGRQTLNVIHRDAGGPVAPDHLPDPERWRAMLPAAGLALVELIDQPDLFLVAALASHRPPTV